MTDPLNKYGHKIVFEVNRVSYGHVEETCFDDFTQDEAWKELCKSDIFAIQNRNEEPNQKIVFSTIYNLEFDPVSESNETVHVKDHVFPIDINQSYFHALYDNIGQFLLAKNYFPDIKPIFINAETDPNALKANYKKDLMDMIGLKEEEIINGYEYSAIKFDKITVIHADANTVMREVRHRINSDRTRLEPFLHPKSSGAAMLYCTSKHLKGLIYDRYLKNREKPTKKVYISRMALRPLFDRTNLLKKFLLANNVSWDSEGRLEDPDSFLMKVNLEAFAPANVFGPMREIDFRYLSLEDELLIEDFFKGKGYEIIYPERMGLTDQINVYISSTHIATLGGAGSVNSLFLGDSGTIVYIAPDTRYEFYHEDIIDSITNNSIIPIDKRKIEYFKGRTSVSHILNVLQNEYGDRL